MATDKPTLEQPTNEEMASLRALPVLRLDSPMMRGAVVLSLQMRLNGLLRKRIREDCIFGVETWGAVKEFQKLKGLEQSGEVNLETWAKLLER